MDYCSYSTVAGPDRGPGWGRVSEDVLERQPPDALRFQVLEQVVEHLLLFQQGLREEEVEELHEPFVDTANPSLPPYPPSSNSPAYSLLTCERV